MQMVVLTNFISVKSYLSLNTLTTFLQLELSSLEPLSDTSPFERAIEADLNQELTAPSKLLSVTEDSNKIDLCLPLVIFKDITLTISSLNLMASHTPFSSITWKKHPANPPPIDTTFIS